MAALKNRRHERVAQLLAFGKSAEEASVEAGFPPGTSFKANARKRANRRDIKARTAELQGQMAACAVIDAAWIKGRVARIAGVDIKAETIRASDVIAAAALLAKMTPDALVPQKIAPTNPAGDGAPLAPEDTLSDFELARGIAFILSEARRTALKDEPEST